MHSIIHTPKFKADAKTAGVTDDEQDAIDAEIAANPQGGALIRETGGLRKVRIATEDGGQSGGYRVFFYYAADDVPVFLLRVISKGQDENISKADRNKLRKILPGLAADYRADVKAKAKAIRARKAQ